ncbi:glucose-1-phosphate thymidylyltransferase [Clostridia bacterium]|nr:glucose-1-phosphate thymidylyltransferase [Clostridia bacterium]
MKYLIHNADLFDLSHTIAKELFITTTYPWEILDKISDFILTISSSLHNQGYQEIKEHIWVGQNVKIAETAVLTAPLIIGKNSEIRPGAYLRGSIIIGEEAVIGNSTEIKNAILFDGVQVPHYNYVGDSILGHLAHMGAGAITSNVKGNKEQVFIHLPEKSMETGRKKVGAMIGDKAEIGCHAVLNPGTVVGRNTQIYPLCNVRGVIPEEIILKSEKEMVFIRS